VTRCLRCDARLLAIAGLSLPAATAALSLAARAATIASMSPAADLPPAPFATCANDCPERSRRRNSRGRKPR
jgi:hypothetical protein